MGKVKEEILDQPELGGRGGLAEEDGDQGVERGRGIGPCAPGLLEALDEVVPNVLAENVHQQLGLAVSAPGPGQPPSLLPVPVLSRIVKFDRIPNTKKICGL